MPARLASARFVGRGAELAELLGLLDAAADERAQLAFVTGESGVGKTRLVNELASRAAAAGARVLSGDCIELGESELPYAPIVSALRPLARRQDPVLDDLGPARAELAQLLPELGAASELVVDPSSRTAQGRLFELLLGLLERLGRDEPVVLVVEDIHWADRSTRDFLVFLSRAVCRERVLVVATYRTEELHRRHPLRPVVAELERMDRSSRIALEPFTRAELAAQLEDILGEPADAALVDRLLARSEGNPLYTEELLASGGDGSAELPPTLRDALMVRVEALSEPAQELLRVVAAGGRVHNDILREVSGLDGRVLRDALREAVASRLLEPDEEGRFAFRHALLREAVHDDLLPGEHSELHAALAAAIAGCADGELDHLTEVAHHWTAAGDQPRALVAAIAAADAAERVHAAGEASAQLERALALWERVPDAEALAGCDHIDLLRRAAQAHNVAGDHTRMRTLLRQALTEVDRDAEPERAAATLERLGKALWELGRGDEALDAYDEALAELPDSGASAVRAAILAAQARGRMLAGRFEEGVALARETIAVAREAGDRHAEDHALNTLGVCLASIGDVEGGEAALRESMAIARAEGHQDDLVRSYCNLAETLFLVGRPHEARETAKAGLDELGWSRACRWLALQLSEIEFHLGDISAAELHVGDDVTTTTSGTSRVYALLRRAENALARGDHGAALVALHETRDRLKHSIEPQWHAATAALLAQAYRRERRYDDARAAVAEGLDRVGPRGGAVPFHVTRVVAAGVAAEADRAEHARARGRAGEAEAEAAAARAAELLEIARDAVRTPQANAYPVGLANAADAEAEALRAAGRADPEAHAAAAAGWDTLGSPYPAALARRRQAETLAALGKRDAAAEVVAVARDAAQRSGAAWLVDELDGLARRARLRMARDDEEAAAEPVEEDPLGLTPREREVLALLAEGRTNREIGETLFMAEKTASVHVSRILAKLDVRTRTEAAAVAHRLGLAA